MRNPITRKGYEQLKEELDRLRKVERPRVIQDLSEARSHGDLTENAEYEAAKERQAFLDARIRELEGKLANAQIIDPPVSRVERVVFGTTVLVREKKGREERRYTLVGPDEADLKNGRISIQSPVGRALMGHRVGDLVQVVTPARTVEYEVVDIVCE